MNCHFKLKILVTMLFWCIFMPFSSAEEFFYSRVAVKPAIFLNDRIQLYVHSRSAEDCKVTESKVKTFEEMSSFRARDLFFVAILKPNLNNIFHQEMFVKNWFQDELGVKPSDLIAMARKFCNEPNNKKIDEYTGVYIYYYIDGFLFNKDRRKIYVNNEIEIPQIINIDVFESLSSERMKERIDGLRSYYMNFIGFRQSPPIYKLGNYWDTAHSEDLDGFKYSITIENIAASYAKRSRELAK